MAEDPTNENDPQKTEQAEGTEEPRLADDVVESAPPAPEIPAVVKEESRFQRGLRKTFRYTAAIVIIFGLGMLFMYYMFQRPRIQELTDRVQNLQAENEDLSGQVESLHTQVDDLRALGEENAALTDELADSELHVQLLVVLADVRAAQASLAQNESEQALSLLSGVPDGLEALQAAVPGESQGEVDSMMSRVTLAIEGIETDQFAAQSDLEVLANSLIQLENNLFVTP